MRRILTIGGLFVVALCAPGCGSEGKTVRMAPDDELSMETGLTSQDFRSVAQNMTRSMIQTARIARATAPPTVAFQRVRNNTADIINTKMYLDRMRSELIRFSEGRVRFLDRELLEATQRENAAKAQGEVTTSGDKPVLGADLFLTGQIDSIDKISGRNKVTYWRLSFRLSDAASTEVVWEDEYEVKKFQKDAVGH